MRSFNRPRPVGMFWWNWRRIFSRTRVRFGAKCLAIWLSAKR